MSVGVGTNRKVKKTTAVFGMPFIAMFCSRVHAMCLCLKPKPLPVLGRELVGGVALVT